MSILKCFTELDLLKVVSALIQTVIHMGLEVFYFKVPN